MQLNIVLGHLSTYKTKKKFGDSTHYEPLMVSWFTLPLRAVQNIHSRHVYQDQVTIAYALSYDYYHTSK